MFLTHRRKKSSLSSALKHNMQQQRWLLFTISMLVSCCLRAQPPAASIAPSTASRTDIVIAGPFSNETDTTASGLLPANSHWISFHITCGSCNDSPHTMLEYRLNTPAYNSNWAALPKTGKVVFQQLKSGKYLLQVRNQTAILPAAVAVFEVDKIWYRKTFWLVILVITAALILYLFFKLYHSRLIHKKNELEEKVLERTSELLQSNQALKEKINELDIIRANLTKTNRLSEQLISILSHDVHSPLRFSTMVGKAVLTKQ